MSDVIEGTVTPSVANAGTRAGGMLLRLVDLQMKYGVPTRSGAKELVLSPATVVAEQLAEQLAEPQSAADLDPPPSANGAAKAPRPAARKR